MNNITLKNGLRFILLILLQVLVFNRLSLKGFLIPYVYVAFILLLPYHTGKSWLLILGFLSGLTIDLFGNTLGLHAAAATLLAYARPGVINFYFPKVEFSENESPSMQKLGLGGFIKYAFTLIFIHHFALVFLEVFTFRNFFGRLEQVFFNTLYTLIIITILFMFFSKREKKSVLS